MRSSRSSPSTWVSNSASALVILRGASRVIAPSRALASDDRLVGVVLGQDDRQHPAEARRARRRIVSGGRSPPVSTNAGGRGQHGRRVREHRRQQHLGAIAGRDQHRAVGDALHQVRQRHRRHDQVQRLAAEQLGVARDHLAVAGRGDLPDRRRHQQVDLRQRVDRHARRGRGDRVELEPAHAVGDHADDVAAPAAPRRQRDRGRRRDLLRRALVPGDHQQRGQPEVQRDARVERQLARRVRPRSRCRRPARRRTAPRAPGSARRSPPARPPRRPAPPRSRRRTTPRRAARRRRAGAAGRSAGRARGRRRPAGRCRAARRRRVEQLLDAERDRGLARRRLAARDVDAGGHARSVSGQAHGRVAERDHVARRAAGARGGSRPRR